MNLIDMRVEDLKPYHTNPRVIGEDAIASVAASIRDFGFRQPIVVDKDHVIVIGHARLQAAQRLGLETVPVHVALDLTDEKARALRLADNKSGEFAQWADDILTDEFAAIQEAGFSLEDYGFDFSVEATEAFAPTANPHTGPVREVSGSDIGEAQENLNTRHAMAGQQDLLEVICPHCAETFEIARDAL